MLRTPDSRFSALPDFPFEPHYLDVDGLRMHYVEVGKKDAETLLLLHGEPSWSYLYRKMIPVFEQAGYRVIAPDLIGFGRSDKLPEQSDYSYQKHVDWMKAFIRQLDLREITLFCQDWGGLIGLRVAAEAPERFRRIVAANTFLPMGNVKMPEAFMQWREFSRSSPAFDVGRVIQRGCASQLPEEVLAAYDAPFPDDSYKAGARIFPSLVPIRPEDPAVPANQRAWQVLMQWKKPFLTLFSDQDPITRGGDAFFQKVVPGAKGQPHETIVGAGHFLQEDKGEEIAQKVVKWMKGIG
jgi:haloalkane dehalogenase